MVGLIREPGLEGKLDLLTQSARYDVCLASCNGNACGGVGRLPNLTGQPDRWIYPAHVPGKGQVGILKVLQTNVCRNHCAYCALAAQRDGVRRTTFTPDELARIAIELLHRRLVHGIFLSPGV